MSLREEFSWMDYALCAELSPKEINHLFFQLNPANPERGLKRNRREAAAQEAEAICNKCLVRKPCLEDALKHPEQAECGIRGGLTPEERRVILRRGEAVIDAAIKSVD